MEQQIKLTEMSMKALAKPTVQDSRMMITYVTTTLSTNIAVVVPVVLSVVATEVVVAVEALRAPTQLVGHLGISWRIKVSKL